MNDKTNIVALSNMLSDLSAYAQQASKQLTRLTNQSTRNIAEFINEDMMNIVRDYNYIAKEYKRLCEEHNYEPFWLNEMK